MSTSNSCAPCQLSERLSNSSSTAPGLIGKAFDVLYGIPCCFHSDFDTFFISPAYGIVFPLFSVFLFSNPSINPSGYQARSRPRRSLVLQTSMKKRSVSISLSGRQARLSRLCELTLEVGRQEINKPLIDTTDGRTLDQTISSGRTKRLVKRRRRFGPVDVDDGAGLEVLSVREKTSGMSKTVAGRPSCVKGSPASKQRHHRARTQVL